MRTAWICLAASLVLVALASDSQAQDAQVDSGTSPEAGDHAPPGTPESIPVVSGMAVRFAPPQGWTSVKQTDTSFLDLSSLSGAHVVVARSWLGPKLSTSESSKAYPESSTLICVQAPVSDWAPGLEQLVFDRMNDMAKDGLNRRSSIDNFTAGPLVTKDTYFQQSFQAHGELGEGHAKGQPRVLVEERPDRPHNHARDVGVHILTVPAGTTSMVACTVTCGETERPGQKLFSCDEAVATFEPLGDLVREPSVTALGKLGAGFKRAPATALGIGFGLLLILVGIVVAGKTLLSARSSS